MTSGHMNFSSLQTRRLSIVVITLLVSVALFRNLGTAQRIDNQTDKCADVLVIFARGSSSNNGNEYLEKPFDAPFKRLEEVPGAFFQQIEKNINRDYPKVDYKAVSVHNFPNKYNDRGYPAVGIFGPATINNAINAKLTWWPWGDYQNSVADGEEETVGYIKDEIAHCPEQQIVLGGYSQGADLMGRAIFKLTAFERSRVAALNLFGDPKFQASDYNPLKFWQKSKPYPWKRGTAGEKSRGLAGARDPYTPEDMKLKTFSWCFDDDFVCTGGDGINTAVTRSGGLSMSTVAAGHERYSWLGAKQAADETIQLLSPILYARNRNKGGVDNDKGVLQNIPTVANDKPIDFMYLVNTSTWVDDLLGYLRHETDNVVEPLEGFFTNVQYGIMDYNEDFDAYQKDFARITMRQQIKPFQRTTSGNLTYNFLWNVGWGQRSYGGGTNYPDPHGLAIERAVTQANWREGATKNLVLFTNRPAKESVTYDICNTSLLSYFGMPDKNVCTPDNTNAPVSTQLGPLICENTRMVLTQQVCTAHNDGNKWYIHEITRKLQDELALATAKGVAITIVVPNKPYPRADYPDMGKMYDQLKKIAESTGGLFLTYDSFNKAAYSDVMWRVLSNKPKTLSLTSFNLDTTQSPLSQNGFKPQSSVIAHVNVPTILDVSQSGQTYQIYKWDYNNDGEWDESTDSPNTTHIFKDVNSTGMLTVAGYSENKQQALLTLPVTVEQTQDAPRDLTPPAIPTSLTATKISDGSIRVSWKGANIGTLVFIADSNGDPIVSAADTEESIVIPGSFNLSGSLQAWVVNGDLVSERVTLPIETEPIPVVSGGESQLNGIVSAASVQTTPDSNRVNLQTAQVAGVETSTPKYLNRIPSSAASFTNIKTEHKPITPILVVILSIVGVSTMAVICHMILKRS